jgi:hypothetical protein
VDGSHDNFIAFGSNREGNSREIFLLLFLRRRFNFACASVTTLSLSPGDRDGTEVDIDQKLPHWFGWARLVDVFLWLRKRGPGD